MLSKKLCIHKDVLMSSSKQFDPKKTIYIFDGSSFLYRAYYGLRPLHAPNGMAVQAVYSFCRMLKKLIDECNMQYVAIVWDSKGKTTRHELYPEYKATRQAPPSDIFDQKEYILQFADLIHAKQVAVAGIEADDLMYSIAQEQCSQGMNAVLITLDKDMRQAVSQSIWLYDPLKQKLIDPSGVEEATGGIPVEKIPFYYALIGDSSDNIPGVKGIGPKTAHDLVLQFDSLSNLYANIHLVKKGKIQELLIDQKQQAFLSLDLFLLQYHPTSLKISDFYFDASLWSNAYPLFEELGFKSLLPSITQKETLKQSLQDKKEYWERLNFMAVTTIEQLHSLRSQLEIAGTFSCDTETDGLRPLECSLVGISFSTDTAHSWYVPCGHQTNEAQCNLTDIQTILGPVLADASYKKIMHNAKFDLLVLHTHELPVDGVIFDTMIAARLCMQEWQKIGLKPLSEHFFNEEMFSYDEIIKQQKLPNFAHVTIKQALLYAAADARQTMQLYWVLSKELQERNQTDLYYSIEHPIMLILYRMERYGIAIDENIIEKLSLEVAKEVDRLEYAIAQEAGAIPGTINLNSPKQIEQLLFYTLKLPPQKRSGKGTAYSTDHEVLMKLRDLHAVVNHLLSYRELSKLKNTYIDVLPLYINPRTKSIHTTFSQTTVATGRLSSMEPNLQNIPASGYGLAIRDAFKPKKDHIFISADYSQIELRVLAHLSHDQRLIDAFINDRDIHQETAAQLFDISLDAVTHEQRQLGKRINFSVLYGLTPYGLSRDLDISFSQAKQYIDRYFKQFSQVSIWMENIIEQAKEYGYVETFWKRRRYIPAIHERNKTLYQEACRVAINTVVQGTAADIMKLGMIALQQTINREGFDAHLVLQIHDELLISANQSQLQTTQSAITTALETVTSWSTPFKVSIRSGYTWKEVSK